MTVNRAQR